jgi:hypothetical protein
MTQTKSEMDVIAVSMYTRTKIVVLLKQDPSCG